MYQRQKKNEKTARHPKNTWRLQRCKEHPRNQICKEEGAHHQDKEWDREKSSRLEKGLQLSLDIFFLKTTTMNKKNLNKKSERMKMRAASMCTTTTPMRWRESQRSRQKSCELQINKLKKRQNPRQQRNPSTRHQSMRRWDERNGEPNPQRNHEAEWIHAIGMEKSENKSDIQRRRCGKGWKLPPDLLIASVVQTVHDHTVQQIISTTWPKTSGRSGGIDKFIPDNRSSCDVQKDWAQMPRVGNHNVDSDKNPAVSNTEKDIQRPECICTDRRRKQQVRDQEKNQTGRSSVKPAFQHGSIWKTTFHGGKRKKGMGIYLNDNDKDCLTNLRFADDVLLFASSEEQLQKMSCEFKKSTEQVGLRTHPEKTPILSNQSSDTKKKLKTMT